MKKVRIDFDKTPISTQHCYGNRVFGKRVIRYMSAKGKQYKKELRETIRNTLEVLPLWGGDIEVKLWLFFGDKRRRDIDNYNKIILDAMEGLIYKDDTQIVKITINKLKSEEGKIVIEVIENE
jgi:crossover junction endodeoxyribonuclease RusA|tara:strand:- start:1365 stop:1733 length:369 start_codon:yes stop_codon:yes gene_type:complete